MLQNYFPLSSLLTKYKAFFSRNPNNFYSLIPIPFICLKLCHLWNNALIYEKSICSALNVLNTIKGEIRLIQDPLHCARLLSLCQKCAAGDRCLSQKYFDHLCWDDLASILFHPEHVYSRSYCDS